MKAELSQQIRRWTLQPVGTFNMETTTGYAENNTGSRTSINQVAGTYVTGDQGSLTMKAGRNVNLKAADIGVSGEESDGNN
jgi:hypothetical protein